MSQFNNSRKKPISTNDVQLEMNGLEIPSASDPCQSFPKGRYPNFQRPLTSPNLFRDQKTNIMASNKVIWESCNILTQGKDLNWITSGQGATSYEVPVAKGQGYITFYLTENLQGFSPAVLEGEAALALIEQFDVRAACMHLIYAAHATQLARPWEQQFVLSDTQLEKYLGLDHNKKLNKQQKLQMMLDLAKQPCHLLVYVSWPSKGKLSSFSISRTCLWEIAEPILHFQDCFYDSEGNPIGEKQLIGFTLKIRCGNWAQYFLNSEKSASKSGYYQCGVLSQKLLHNLMSLWHHHENAVRLMTWLLFKTRVNCDSPITVRKLMEVAFGNSLIENATAFAPERRKLVRRWEKTLSVLLEKGWFLQPDLETYPLQYWPDSELLADIPNDPEDAVEFWSEDASCGRKVTDLTKRSRSGFEQLLNAKVQIHPPTEIAEKLNLRKSSKNPRKAPTTIKTQLTLSSSDDCSELTGNNLRTLRQAYNLSQRDLSDLTGISQKMISFLENNKRRLTHKTRKRLAKVLTQDSPIL